MDLTQKHCVPCEGGTPPFALDQINHYLPQIDASWTVVNQGKLVRDFKFKDFVESMKFTNQVADVAEAEGHHPNLHIYYSKVTLELWTHAVAGLSENDFILAAKIDQIHS